MRELKTTPEEAAVLNRYLQAGGVVDFVFIGCTDSEGVESDETQRRAILLGMKTLQERLGYFSEFAVDTESERLEPVRAPFEIDEDRLNALRTGSQTTSRKCAARYGEGGP